MFIRFTYLPFYMERIFNQLKKKSEIQNNSNKIIMDNKLTCAKIICSKGGIYATPQNQSRRKKNQKGEILYIYFAHAGYAFMQK